MVVSVTAAVSVIMAVSIVVVSIVSASLVPAGSFVASWDSLAVHPKTKENASINRNIPIKNLFIRVPSFRFFSILYKCFLFQVAKEPINFYKGQGKKLELSDIKIEVCFC